MELEALLTGKDCSIAVEGSDKMHSPGEDSSTTLVSEHGDVAMADTEPTNDAPDDIPVIDLDLDTGRGMYWTTWPTDLPSPETVQPL